ncbi:hypothetical protein [Chryseobacterium salviniae]|uniref:Uncharacterized protein n=1 Tax=Chryseobacterium salviniae TaxID=3101750 RepID=A0ABU6HMF1_9FLAO|nr:hypothetical protein [Chryseobacterium sp. T9W2-O]MEC3874113.1 hypothetical protein [Chryseobacterium sp. T9W2-O]
MKNFNSIKEKYVSLGVPEKHIDYTFNAVKSGSKREIIVKNLTSDVRNVDHKSANCMLDDMFSANGGEFKYENRSGYIYSIFYLIAIVVLLLFITFSNNDSLVIKLSFALIPFLVLFLRTFIPTLKGKFRE